MGKRGEVLRVLGRLVRGAVGDGDVHGLISGGVEVAVHVGCWFADRAAVPIMTYAGSAPTLASGSSIAAFNVGNTLGAWLGGLTNTAGLGYTSPPWIGAALSAAALVVLLVADRVARRATAYDEREPLVVASGAALL